MIEINGKNGISVKVIADSIAVNGKRMTTFELVYHRFIHSEFMTHRDLSKNASSSRAVPLKTAAQHVADNPAIPVHWGKNQSGMQAKEHLSGIELSAAQEIWQKGIENAVDMAGQLQQIESHKQWASRPLEPFQMIKTVVSGSIVQIKNTKTGMTVTYTIVSEEEADLKAGKISVSSPFGKGLLGKKVGDLAEITAPAGKLEFEIMSLTR